MDNVVYRKKVINRPPTHKRVIFDVSIENLRKIDAFCAKTGGRRPKSINFMLDYFFEHCPGSKS